MSVLTGMFIAIKVLSRVFISNSVNSLVRSIYSLFKKKYISYYIILQSFPFKNAVDVASNGERFTLANAANLKTYIPDKITVNFKN
jgi:hypothetical protein